MCPCLSDRLSPKNLDIPPLSAQPRIAVRIVAVASAFLVVASCGGSADETPPAPTEVTGTIEFVDTVGSKVTGFSLRGGGETYRVAIADDVDYGFELRHLEEHAATGDPVRCRLEERDGQLYALRVDDA